MHYSPATNRKIWLTVLAIIVFIGIILGLLVHRLYTPAVLSSSALRDQGFFLFDKPRMIDDFALSNHHAEPFSLEDLQGHWTMIFFGFTYCPDICPTTMALLNTFYNEQQSGPFGKDLQIIMVSVDPARDTPDKLEPYVTYFNPEFTGVTGDFIVTHKLATQLAIPFAKVPGGGEDYLIEHSANIALINPQGHYVGFFKAPLDVEQLNKTYHSVRLKNEGHF